MSSRKRDYTPKERVRKVPNNELPDRLARITYHAQELHKLTTNEKMGEIAGVERQTIDYHVQKIRKGKDQK